MLKIEIPGDELWDSSKEEFIYSEGLILELEHSLVSVSKWEAIHEKPFLSKDEKTNEELLSYIKAMIVHPKVLPSDKDLLRLSGQHLSMINQHINAKMTATWFRSEKRGGQNTEVITAELIYYWMITLTIPIEFEHWHLNRLFTLIKVFNVKNSPGKKMSSQQLASRNRDLNAQRKAQLGTNG